MVDYITETACVFHSSQFMFNVCLSNFDVVITTSTCQHDLTVIEVKTGIFKMIQYKLLIV